MTSIETWDKESIQDFAIEVRNYSWNDVQEIIRNKFEKIDQEAYARGRRDAVEKIAGGLSYAEIAGSAEAVDRMIAEIKNAQEEGNIL